MFKLEADILGTRQIDFAVSNLLRKVTDFRDLWPSMVTVLHGVIKRNYDAQGAGSPRGRWAPLSPKYAKWKAEKRPGRPILVFDGVLRASLTQRGAEGSIVETSQPMSMRVSTSVPYAVYHQRGVPENNLPMRRPVDLSPRDQLAIAKEVQRYVNTDALKGFGSVQRSLPFGSGV